MERLKAALDKARETRASGGASLRSAPPGRSAAHPSLDQAWASLSPLNLDARALAKRRLIAFGRPAEATPIDVLRTKVLQMAGTNEWRRIAVTSPLPGAGKTTTAINLAVALARHVDLRIVLMDMDMRRPAMARALGVTGKHGVASVLEGRESFGDQARRYGENLAISMNYLGQRDPSDMFLRTQTATVLDRIEAEYRPDFILFDMPPMLVNDDASALMGNVDCALILAEAGSTTADQVDVCEREIAAQTNVLGVVLNKCKYASDSYAQYYTGYN